MFKIFFATPNKKIVADQELEEVTLPAFKGELNILPGHAPLNTTLEAGILRYKLKSGETGKFAISWGYCQVSAEGVNILAEHAVTGDEIDSKVVADHLKTQEEKLATDSLDDADWDKLKKEVSRLSAELDLAAEKTH